VREEFAADGECGIGVPGGGPAMPICTLVPDALVVVWVGPWSGGGLSCGGEVGDVEKRASHGAVSDGAEKDFTE
jgi:hypothetical protein